MELFKEGIESLAEKLRNKVTSPGGTTEKAIEILQNGELEKLFSQALTGARDRSVELSELLGKSSKTE